MHIHLVNLPRYDPKRPPVGVAIIAALCAREGVAHSVQDFALDMSQWHLNGYDPSLYWDVDNFCITGNISPESRQALIEIVDRHVDEVVAEHPDVMFALSLLSTWSRSVAEVWCDSIRRYPTAKILLGGQGLIDPLWTEDLYSRGRIDFFMVGEAEIIFPKFLKGERELPGLNNYNYQQIDDLDTYCVIPDLSKFPLLRYPQLSGDHKAGAYITASRGCVRRCSYCDVPFQWKKYRYRSAQKVADEIIAQYERYGITDFYFTDSLVNGSISQLDELCNILVNYYQTTGARRFRLGGQYIFRPASQVKPDHIARIKAAGFDHLIIGLETGSDRVRFDMNKKHTMDDAEYSLELFRKNDISCTLLMMTGWVTETIDDHQATMNMFPRWQKYVATGTIKAIELGFTLMILDDSPVGQMHAEYGIEMMEDKRYLWTASTNPDLTVHERYRRRVELHRQAHQYKWPVTKNLYRLQTVRANVEEAILIKQKQLKGSVRRIEIRPEVQHLSLVGKADLKDQWVYWTKRQRKEFIDSNGKDILSPMDDVTDNLLNG
jgi:hypothetical protein